MPKCAAETVRAAAGLIAAAMAAMAVLLAAPQTPDAALPAAWAHWRVEAPVRIDPADAGGFVAAIPPPALLAAAARDWSDLRVIDEQGREQPFVIRVRAEGSRIDWRPARVFDPGYVPGVSSQATIDTGAAGGVHNRVRLSLAPIAEDFLTWMEIAVSADAKAWAVVRDRVPIYQLSHAGVGLSFEASYPDSLLRYVRVRVLDGSRRYVVLGAAVAQQIPATRELVDAPVTFAPGPAAADRSVWTSTPATPGLTVGEIRIDSTDPAFDRPVGIEASDDGTTWAHAASGTISRRAVRGATLAQEVVAVGGSALGMTSAAYWRVTIYNGSDRPLAGVQVHAREIPRRVVFRAAADRYRLIAGNPRATAPSYDLARTVDAAALDAAHAAGVDGVVENPGYADPAPWTERHPWVLWAAALLAVAAIGLLAMRTMRGARG